MTWEKFEIRDALRRAKQLELDIAEHCRAGQKRIDALMSRLDRAVLTKDLMPVQHKHIQQACAVKLVDLDAGVVDGYGAVFGNVDRAGDCIVKGAFLRSIRENGSRVSLLWHHHADQPIGVAEGLAEDNFGLKFRGRISRKAQHGPEAIDLIGMRGLECFSIGYRVASNGYRMRGQVCELLELDLLEISIVSTPCNPRARLAA